MLNVNTFIETIDRNVLMLIAFVGLVFTVSILPRCHKSIDNSCFLIKKKMN